jgi:hypothetical protein
VGLLDGDYIAGFADLDTYNNDLHLSQADASWLVIPKKGQLAQAKSYLAKCIQKDKELNPSTSVITICVSCLFYIYFYQRRPEFGLLEALGHTREMLIGKAFLEIAVINLIGFVCGLLGALLSGWALNHFVLMEQGVPLVLWDQSYLFELLSTVLFVTFISLLPIWRMLKKVDPITIIEEKYKSGFLIFR